MAQQFLKLQFPLIFVLCFVSHFFDSHAQNPSPLSYLNHLVGLRKGQRLDGLFELKKYLSKIGYIDNTNDHLRNQPNANIFDNELELAIKTYQKFFRLPISGVLDAQTVDKMKKPRCGVPDDVHQNANPFGGDFSSHYSFFPGKPKWPSRKSSLTYSLAPRTRKDARHPMEVATSAWAKVSHFNFTYIKEYSHADIKISFQVKNHGDEDPFDGPGGTLAHAFAPTNGTLHFDGDESWVDGAQPGKMDIQTVGMHEMGHILGLGHSNDPNALMYPTATPGERKGIGKDDIKGIKALYPA